MDLERAEALDLLRRLRTQIVFGQLLVSFSSLVGFRSSAGSNWLPHYRNEQLFARLDTSGFRGRRQSGPLGTSLGDRFRARPVT